MPALEFLPAVLRTMVSETSTLVLGPLSELGVPPGSVISGQSLDFTFPYLPTELDFLGVLP